jgi:hypothetical protein
MLFFFKRNSSNTSIVLNSANGFYLSANALMCYTPFADEKHWFADEKGSVCSCELIAY